MRIREIGRRPLSGMVRMGVIKPDDIFAALAPFPLNADQFFGIDVVPVVGGIGARVAGARVAGAGYAGGNWQGGKWQGGNWQGGNWRGGRWHGRYWPYYAAVGVGIGLGGYYGGYYDDYYPYVDDTYYVDPGYVDPGYTDSGYGGDVAYCIQRFRTYDLRSGTYVGKGGRRIACP